MPISNSYPVTDLSVQQIHTSTQSSSLPSSASPPTDTVNTVDLTRSNNRTSRPDANLQPQSHPLRGVSNGLASDPIILSDDDNDVGTHSADDQDLVIVRSSFQKGRTSVAGSRQSSSYNKTSNYSSNRRMAGDNPLRDRDRHYRPSMSTRRGSNDSDYPQYPSTSTRREPSRDRERGHYYGRGRDGRDQSGRGGASTSNSYRWDNNSRGSPYYSNRHSQSSRHNGYSQHAPSHSHSHHYPSRRHSSSSLRRPNLGDLIHPTTPNRTIWLARHGNREDFVDPTWKSTAENPSDTPLSQDGFLDAECLATLLTNEASKKVDVIVASPFTRTIQTAYPTAKALSMPIFLEPGFGEHANPKWWSSPPTPPSIETLLPTYPLISQSHTPHALTIPFPETYKDLYARVAHTFNHIIARTTGNLLIVTHGAVVTALAAQLTRRPANFKCPTGCVCEIEVDESGGYRGVVLGSTGHLTHDGVQINERLN